VHKEINFMPSEEFRSPAQHIQFKADEAEKARIAQLKKEQRAAEELRLQTEAEEAQRLSERAAALSLQAQTDPLILFLVKYNVACREVFEGAWMNKKFTSEMMYRRRFVWIDHSEKRLYWSKVEGKDDPNKKSIDISEDVGEVRIGSNRISLLFKQKELNGKSIQIQSISGDKERVIADFAKVAETMRTG